MTKRSTRAVRVGIFSGVVICRGCMIEWPYWSSTDRVAVMRLVRKHVSETGHTADFEDATQTTVEPTE